MRSGEQLNHVFRALSDPIRRDMLALLSKGERSASELGEPFAISQPAASKHIGKLERAGLVARAVDGRVHRFRLVPRPLHIAESWIVRHQRFWEASLDALDQVLADMGKENR